MKERIAVAIDFSPESEVALEEAIAIARTVGAEVHLIHVAARIDGDYESAALLELDRANRAEARERLAEIHERYDGQGVEISQSLIDGFPDEAICRAAMELDCRTIAIGTHGRTGLRRFFLGSIAEKVARLAKRDVLVARGTRPRRGFSRIMVPTDFSLPAERALARAVELACPGAEIDLVHIWQLPGPVTHHYSPLSSHLSALKRIGAEIRAEAEGRAEPLLAKYRRDGVGIDFTAVQGSPGPAIVDRAAGCDLIVMGTHGRRGFYRFALGSVAERTIRHAPCSVLTTFAEDTEEK